VPAILTYLAMDIRREQLFAQGSSNGLAAGTTFEDAAIRAVLELVERDAFMCAWLLKKPGQRIALDHTLAPGLRSILSGLQALGARTELLLIPAVCDFPAVLALAFGDGVSYPGVTLGLGTHPDPRVALRQAILEVGQTGPYLRRLMINNAYPVPATCKNVREMKDHAAYYFPLERASGFDFLLADSSEVRVADLPNRTDYSLPAIASALAQAAIRVALIDVTASGLMASPLRVVRALSPDLQPIHFGYGMDRLPVGRLGTVSIRPNDLTPIW
jgi:thiazole/oxazole-forming peptide maturase SagD family component